MIIFCWRFRIADTAMSVEAMAPQINDMIASKMKIIVQLAHWSDAERTLLHSSGCVQCLVQQFLFRRFCKGDINGDSRNSHLIKNLKHRYSFILQLFYLVSMAQCWRTLSALLLDWPKTPKKEIKNLIKLLTVVRKKNQIWGSTNHSCSNS